MLIIFWRNLILCDIKQQIVTLEKLEPANCWFLCNESLQTEHYLWQLQFVLSPNLVSLNCLKQQWRAHSLTHYNRSITIHLQSLFPVWAGPRTDWPVHLSCNYRVTYGAEGIIMQSHRLSIVIQNAGAHRAQRGLRGGSLRVYKYQDLQLADQWRGLCCHSNWAKRRGEEEHRWGTWMAGHTQVNLRRVTQQCSGMLE